MARRNSIRAAIKEISYYLPESIVTNEMLQKENPGWDMPSVESRCGVHQRHVARTDETTLDLAVEAGKRLFARHEGAHSQIDGLLFCTQSPDHIMPPNACILHKLLKLRQDTFAMDFNLACSGYVYGLALAQGLLATGVASNILLVTGDTYSKYIHKQDRSARVLFGDGAAVSWITASEDDGGILDIQCATAGEHYDKFIIPAGGCRMPRSPTTCVPQIDESGNVRTPEAIHMDGLGILTFVNSRVPQQVQEILSRNKMTQDDIQLFIFHQASKVVLDYLARALEIKPTKMFRNLYNLGNTVSASIPIALKEALDSGAVHRGDRVLLCGFGVGLSWGTSIVEI
jgi:3-oxoacyl-[acyl-carrier-protein] synthase III